MFNLLLAGNTGSSIVTVGILVVLLLFMIILPNITNKKRTAAYHEMQDSLKAGDKVQTIGGIVGRVVRVSKNGEVKTIIIETGNGKESSYLEFNIDAIAGVVKNEAETTTVAGTEPEIQEVDIQDLDVDAMVQDQPEKKDTKNKK